MDIEAKRNKVKEDLAKQPANVVFARIDICDEIQLADLMKVQFIPYLRQAANTSHSTNSDSLHQVCVNLAKQRALLHGANVNSIMKFDIGSITDYNTNGDISLPNIDDSTYNNKTSLPYVVMHDLNEDGGIINLSTTSNANTTITNDEGTDVKYFTDFSKYFLTRSRANGELITIDENNAPYTSPSTTEPFFPANTINGETYAGTASDPTANTDVRHDFFLTPNTTAVGYAGANNDITENKYQGNTFVTLTLSNVTGTFSSSETIKDFDGTTSTVKSASNTTSVLIEASDTKGTFTVGETLTDLTSNSTIEKVESISNTEINITLTGSTFLTGSNTSLDLGFTVANTITLDENTVVRTGSKVVVTTNSHGISPGDYVVLKGATDDFSEFNDTFSVDDVTQNTLTFTTSNSVSVTPTGDFSLMKNIVFGRTSNASAAIHARTINASANVVFQSDDLSAGFPIGNTITGQSSSATGFIENRITGGAWYQVKTNEIKTYYIASDSGTWDYDATNNPQGMETSANTGEFWLKYNEMVKINQLVASSGSGNSFVSKKIVLDIAIATSSDKSGGYDSNIDTMVPGIYFAYPLKTYEDQVHDGVTTLEAYQNFANVVIAPEGLEINFDWKPLGNTSGPAINGTHLSADGTVTNSAYNPEEVTVLDMDEFNEHLGPYNGILTSTTVNDVFRSSNPNIISSGVKKGISGAVYLSVNTNPFFPALSGKHKNHQDIENDLTGTQPSSLTANDIFAGAYSEYQKDAQEPSGDYRYAIQNDQKWIYASPSGIAYNTPNAADQKDIMFSGTATATSIAAVASKAAITGGSGTSTVTSGIGPNNAGSCNSSSGPSSPANNKKTFTVGGLTIGSISYTSIMRVLEQACVITTPAGCGNSNHTTYTLCYNAGHHANWNAAVYGFDPDAVNTEVACAYNRVQQWLTATGANVSVGSVTGMQPNMAVLYQILLTLTSSDYGISYVDPNEPSSPGSEPCRSDVSFRKETQDCKKAIDDLIVAHAAYKTGTGSISGHNFASAFSRNTGTNGKTYVQCITGSTAGSDGVKSAEAEIGTYKDGIKNRITEITNRIGCLNGKNTAVGGNTAMQVTVGSANDGFTGYSFNSGNGYANTIYSHANFLAGKKINLLGKILTAINNVQTLYDQIKSKRSEFYEYNQ